MAAQLEQNPAGGPGFGGEHAIDDAHPCYRISPAEGTNRRRILDALRAGRRLTSREAWIEFGAARLAADVHELRRSGWPIEVDTVAVTCRAGRAAWVARYRLAERTR